ncbi:MAG: hypothetical protein ACKVUS_13185 [Saprospiraceae bacterium]
MIFIAAPLLCVAQKHDYNWLFGYYNNVHPLLGGANINFNTMPPSIYVETKKIDLSFYCGVCSDSSGHLAFYTNGISIRDTTHNRMLNGDTLNPGPIWLDWQNDSYPNGPFCFALPAPGQHNQYCFFHMATVVTDSFAGTSPFYYTIVDMEGNNGLGQVTQKNQLLLPGSDTDNRDYIDPVAVKHGNGRDWWVITGEVQSPLMHIFLLDPDGVHGPFTTVMPYQFPGTDYQSVNDISPDGNTYIRAAGTLGLYIFDFDRCSGTLGNLRAMPFANQDFFGFATVFAPDSKHLYLSSRQAVTVIDLSATDIIASLDTLAYFDGKASPQQPFVTGFWNPNLGPDGKIYYATTNSTLSMHLIHNPDLPGHAADVEQHGLSLPKYNSGTMCLFPNYRLGEWEGSPCDTLNGQRPGDGFAKSDWYPPALARPEGYTLLPPLFDNAQPSEQPRARDLNMAELALKRREEEKKKAESGKKEDKN